MYIHIYIYMYICILHISPQVAAPFPGLSIGPLLRHPGGLLVETRTGASAVVFLVATKICTEERRGRMDIP